MRSLFLPLLVVFLLPTRVLFAQESSDPMPRSIRSRLIQEWTFDDGLAGWEAENQCTLKAVDGLLKIQSTGNDPFFHVPVDFPGGQIVVRLRVRTRVGRSGSAFWTTNDTPTRDPQREAHFPLPDDGTWTETETRFQASGQLTDLRIDPGMDPGLIEIDWIRVSQEQLHPLTVTPVEAASQLVRFLIQNHDDEPVRFSVANEERTIGANDRYILDQPVPDTRPLQPVTVVVRHGDWPPITRTVWFENESAESQWIERTLGQYQLQVASDGSTARVRKGNQLVVTLAPLVSVDGQLPKLKAVEDNAAIRFEGDGVKMSLLAHDAELTIKIQSEQECEGPSVRAKGGLEQGLFAGLEYLGKGERSSSKLDIESEGHMRFVPDPLKVTLPLMSFVTDRVTAAMTWDDMTLQPVYATPNVFDGTPDHRMALRGQRIDCTLRLDQVPVEETIRWAVQKKGLPPLPKAPRTRQQQAEICLKALNGPLRTEAGWGHCVQDNWKRQPFAAMASTLWRLGGEVPDFPHWVLGGSHVPNGTIFFVSGRGQEWLDAQARQVAMLIHQQQADGSYRYDGPFRRGHFENTAERSVRSAGGRAARVCVCDRRSGSARERTEGTRICQTLSDPARSSSVGVYAACSRPTRVRLPRMGVRAGVRADGK